MTYPATGAVTATTAPYAYQALRADGAAEYGTLDAPSRDAASAMLAARGLFPIELQVALPDAAARRRTLPPADLALGLRALASLLEAGLPLARAVAALDELAPPSWTPTLDHVQRALREGESFAAALTDAPVTMPPLVLGVLRAGEAGGGLAAAVLRAADLTERDAATRAAVRGALAYPIVLAVAGVASLGILTAVVLPRFAAILADLGQALPPTTRAVLAASTLARTLALPAVLGTAVLFALWRAWTGTEAGRRTWDGLMLATPLVGRIRHAAATGRVTAALAVLLDSGVPLAAAVLHAAPAAGNAAVAARLLAARERVLVGERVGPSLAEADALTPTAVRLVYAGEESGRLSSMLAHASKLESERATEAVRSAVRLLEPGLILVFGAVVAFVAAALLQAVYSVRPPA